AEPRVEPLADQAPPPPPPPHTENNDARNSALLLVIAGVAALCLIAFFALLILVGTSGQGDSEQPELAGTLEVEPQPEPVAAAPKPAPEPEVAPVPVPEPEPEDMDIPTPGPLDLGLDPEQPVPTPKPVPEPEVVPQPSPEGQGTDGVAVVEPQPPAPQPEVDPDNPWGTTAPSPEPPAPAPAPEPVLRRIAFSSSPSGAELLVNGEYRGSTPITQALADGDYEITVRLAGHVSQRQSLTVKDGVSALSVSLPKIEVAKPTVEAPGRDGDTLFVDGRPIGTLPRAIEVKPGSHTFTVEGPGGPRLTVTRDVTMADTKITLQ
ncbi:MAG: PEGA domain-containing protein, partial [Deltaproteobacteria bacterium]